MTMLTSVNGDVATGATAAIEVAAANMPESSTGKNTTATTAAKPSAAATKAATAAAASGAATGAGTAAGAAAKPQFPPPKTDKPRPHVCQTCQRSFARLEHLKRHERSHTKEKPFECPQCRRCFARRDLLLRHQQKLHQNVAPNPRPRNRRDSAAAAPAGGRVRKNSVAGQANATATAAAAAAVVAAAAASNHPQPIPRPRANTISHVDGGLQMQQVHQMLQQQMQPPRLPNTHVRHPSLVGMNNLNTGLDLSFGNLTSTLAHRTMSAATLPRIDTNAFHNPFDQSLRTAPAATFDFDYDFLFQSNPATHTINPSALHYNDSPPSAAMDPAVSPTLLNNETAEWLESIDSEWGAESNLFTTTTASSPSAMSNGSPGIHDALPMIPNSDQFLLDNSLHGHIGISSIQNSLNEMALLDTGDQAFSAATAATMWPTASINGHIGALGLDTNFSEFLVYNTGSESPSSAATTLHSAASASSPASSITDTTRDTVANGLGLPQSHQILDQDLSAAM